MTQDRRDATHGAVNAGDEKARIRALQQRDVDQVIAFGRVEGRVIGVAGLEQGVDFRLIRILKSNDGIDQGVTSVAEVGELQRLLDLQSLDDGDRVLKVITLLAGDTQFVALD